MTYLEWNDRLAAHFFSPDGAGRKVQLFATPELIEKIGQIPNGFHDFVAAVKIGPPWAHRQSLCQRALEALTEWRARRLEWPPYIAYLVLFVIAAGVEEAFPPHAYYPRLRKVIGEEPEPRALPSFDKMLGLWDDLEQWSNVDKEGNLGVFQTRLLGSLINVGVPRAQTLLSEEELHQLAFVFAKAGLDPTAIPSDWEIAEIVAREGRERLRNRTLRILKSSSESDAEIRQALIDVILEELREWRGEAFLAADDTEGGGRYQTGALRLCCDIDRTAGRVRMSFRARIPGEFPEEGLRLREAEELDHALQDQGSEYSCEEWGRGWSSVLETKVGTVDAACFDWARSFQFVDVGGQWQFRFNGSRVRILVEGSSEGLSGLVEVRRLPTQSRFYLLAAHREAVPIADWGTTSCDGWEELVLSAGLPRGWRAFSASKARSDEGIREQFLSLGLPTNVSISLQGGIRVSRGNRYFDFAPPAVALEGASAERLSFNGITAGPPNQTGLIEIPSNLPDVPNEEAGRVLIEAWRGQQILDRRTIYLAHGGWSWNAAAEVVSLLYPGGVQVEGLTVPEFDYASAVPLTEHGSVHYVGREAGQIVHWPTEPLPEDWSPVWVIVARRRGEVIFCGSNSADAAPLRGGLLDRKRVRAWKEIIWVRRKQLRPPAHVALRKLWQRYQEIAHDV